MSAVTRLQPISSSLPAIAGGLFAVSAVVVTVWCRTMSAMDMPMPGGWTMSMAWMRRPDQSWSTAAAAFLAMWLVMTVAMMLPAILPALRRHAAALERRGEAAVGVRIAVAGAAYLCVWAAAGLAAFPVGSALAALAMAHPPVAHAMPFAGGGVLLIAGAWQLTRWKARALACCAAEAGHAERVQADPRSAWAHGLRLGLACLRCCGNLMAVLLVVGVMDLLAMAAVTVAITAERLASRGDRIAKAVGVAIMAGAAVVVARALLLT